MRVALIAVVALVTTAPGLAPAAKKASGGRKVVALFLAAKGKLEAGIVDELVARLVAAAPEARIVAHKALKRTLGKKNPDAIIAECRGGAPCLAKLGARVGASEVLYGVLSPAGKGVKARISVVEVASQTATRQVLFELPSVAAVAAAVAERRDELFGAPPVEELPLDAVLGAGPATESSAVEDDPLGDIDLASIPMADAEPEVPPAAAVEATGAGAPPPRWLTWTGVACGGLGVAALGVGGYFGATYRAGPESIDRGPGGTTFVEAQRIYRDADSARRRANLLLLGGGALTAVGAALIGVDLFVLQRGSTAQAVHVGTTGTGAFVRLDW